MADIPASPPRSGSSASKPAGIAVESGNLIREAVEAARTLPRALLRAAVDPLDGTEALLILNADGEVRPLPSSAFDSYRQKPTARRGIAHPTTLASFIDLTNRFKESNSAVFAADDMKAARLTAIFDYHPAVSAEENEARHMRHRAEYAFPFSDEWKAWTGMNAQFMSMAEFAAFLEDHIVDVVADGHVTVTGAALDFVNAVGGTMASPSKLIALARGLQVYENSVLKEARNLSSGTGQLVFDSQHVDADGKPLEVPSLFMICIPIFARSPDFYRLLARLRYRKAQGGVVFWFELWRVDLAFEQAFSEACEKVKAETGLPLFVAKPEEHNP